MIKINIEKQNNLVKYIKISGHSGYAEEGHDIVCASISSIAITTVNSLIRIDEDCIAYNEKDGLLEIELLKHSEVIDKIIENMIDLFSNLSEQYSDYIKINL